MGLIKKKFIERITSGKILGRKSSGTGLIEELSLSEVLDLIGSAQEGDILYRGASAWQRLARGTNGQILTLASGLPSWGNANSGYNQTQYLTSRFDNYNTSEVTIPDINFIIPSGLYHFELGISGFTENSAEIITARVRLPYGLMKLYLTKIIKDSSTTFTITNELSYTDSNYISLISASYSGGLCYLNGLINFTADSNLIVKVNNNNGTYKGSISLLYIHIYKI